MRLLPLLLLVGCASVPVPKADCGGLASIATTRFAALEVCSKTPGCQFSPEDILHAQAAADAAKHCNPRQD